MTFQLGAHRTYKLKRHVVHVIEMETHVRQRQGRDMDQEVVKTTNEYHLSRVATGMGVDVGVACPEGSDKR